MEACVDATDATRQSSRQTQWPAKGGQLAVRCSWPPQMRLTEEDHAAPRFSALSWPEEIRDFHRHRHPG